MKILSKFTIIFLGSFFVSCSGQPLISLPEANLSNLKTLSVKATQYGFPDTDEVFPQYLQGDGSKIFVSNLGYTIALQKAFISWEHLHLISEGSDEECSPGFDTEIDMGQIQNILADDLELVDLSQAQISDHAYCQYEVHLSAENEAFNGADSDTNIAGRSLFLFGTWNKDAASGSFTIAIEDELELAGVFRAGTFFESVEHPLHYHGEQTEKTITFGLAYDSLFTDLDFSDSTQDIPNQVQENLENSLTQFLNTGKSH